MPALIKKLLEDPNAVVAVFSLVVSVVCAVIAVREARAKAREASERLEEAKKFSKALDTVIRAGSSMPRHLERIAEQTSEVVELAASEIKDSVAHLKRASEATEEICKVLRHVGNVALRAQRDSEHAHQELLGKIVTEKEVTKPKPHTDDSPAA